MKTKILSSLGSHYQAVKSLLQKVQGVMGEKISTSALCDEINVISKNWFDEVLPILETAGFAAGSIDYFTEEFSKTLRLSKTKSRKTAYLRILPQVVKRYQTDLIQVVETRCFSQQLSGLNIAPYLEGIGGDEKSFLDEAQKCAASSCLRASIVMGWCATINRIHRKIERDGFDKFNHSIQEMKNRTYGRFKRFTKSYQIDSLSELREVFDTDVLWVLEFTGLIDSNQHERLRHCFTMRNNSAHPGEAPITGENLYSFYSDITQIVLKNPKFNL